MSSLATLKQQLADVLATPASREPALRTGIAALDAVLPAGGIPRGRLTEITGRRGKTTLVRHLVAATLARDAAAGGAGGGWVAYVDAARTLAPREWARLCEGAAAGERVWMVRPADPARGAWCADVLLRSGAFALVVLDGAPPLSSAVAVRLTRLARETNTALVVLADGGAATVGGALRLRVETRAVRGDAGHGARPGGEGRRAPPGRTVPRGGPGALSAMAGAGAVMEAAGAMRSATGAAAGVGGAAAGAVPEQTAARQLRVVIEKGGNHETVEVSCAIGVARRLCTHSEVPDRRGVASRAAGGRVAAGAAPESRPRSARGSRRVAEPDFGRPERGARASSPTGGRARALG